jgi:hypothetical protein
LKKYLKDLREGNWTPRPPRKLSLKLPEGRIETGQRLEEEKGRTGSRPEEKLEQPQSRLGWPPLREKTVRISAERPASTQPEDKEGDSSRKEEKEDRRSLKGRGRNVGRSDEKGKEEKRSKSIHRKLSRMGGLRGGDKDIASGEGGGGDGDIEGGEGGPQHHHHHHHRKLSRVGRGGGGGTGDRLETSSSSSTLPVIGSSYDVIDELTRNIFGEGGVEEDESLLEINFL